METNPRFARFAMRCARCSERRPEVIHTCEGCGRRQCDACSADACTGCAVVAALHAIARGAAPHEVHDVWPPEERPRAEKIADIVGASHRPRDVWLGGDEIVMRWLEDPRRHRYYAEASPHVLRGWLGAVGLSRLAGPKVARVPGGTLSSFDREVRDEIVWLIPHPRGIEARFRAVGPEGAPDAAQDVPESGPWSLPEPWRPPDEWATFAPPGVACPRCGAVLERAKKATMSAAVVCGDCGASFEPDPPAGPGGVDEKP